MRQQVPTAKQFLTGLAITVGTAGLTQGVINGLSGNNFWTGEVPRVQLPKIDPLPTPEIKSLQPEEIAAPETIKPYNSGHQDASEIKLPDKLYHYATDNPETWNSLGKVPGSTQYLTSDGELNSLNARINLALDKTPKFRIEITTSDPNFNPNNIQLIRRVSGNLYNTLPAGGGWEVLYKGIYKPSELYKWTITTIK